MTARRLATLLIVGFVLLPTSAHSQQPVVYQGHADAVSSAAYTPDGKLVVTGSFDRNARIFNAADGKLLRTLQGHTGQIFSVSVSPDGRQAITASRDGTVKKWDLFIPTPLTELAAHESAVQTLAVNAEGTRLVTGGADKAAKLFDLVEGKLLFDLVGHAEGVSRSTFNADATQAATADAAGVVHFWNAADGVSLGSLGAHTAGVTGLLYHPTEPTLLTAAANGVVKRWQLPLTAPTLLATQPAAVTAVCVSPDSTIFALGDAAGAVQLFTAETGKPLTAARLPAGPVNSLAISTDNTAIVAASETGAATIFNSADGAILQTLQGHIGPLHDVRYNAAGDAIATAGDDGTIRIWRQAPAAIPLAGHTLPAAAIASSADGKLIATGGEDKQVLLFTPDGKSAGVVAGHKAAVSAVDISPDAKTVASADIGGAIRITEAATPANASALFGPAGKVTAVDYAPDGKSLVTANESGAVTSWSLPPAPAAPLAGHTMPVTCVAATPNEASLVTGSSDGSIRVFTTATGAAVRSLAGHVGPVVSLAATDALVASGSETGVIQFWNLADGKPAGAIVAHEGLVASLAFAPGGKQIASAGADGAIRIWNPPVAPTSTPGDAMPVTAAAFSADGTLSASVGTLSGKPTVVIRTTADGVAKGSLLGHTAAITSVAFSSDNKKVVTGSADKTARVWDLSDPKFPEIAKFEGHAAAVSAVAISADGKQVFSAAGNSITQWQSADSMEVRALAGHTAAVTSLNVTGAVVVSGSADQTVRTWSAADGKPLATLPHGAAVATVAVSADGKQVAAGDAAGGVKVFAAGKLAATLVGAKAAVTSLAFNKTGDQLAACCADGMYLWNAAGLLRERILQEAASPLAAAFSTDGSKLVGVNAKNEMQTHTPSLVLATAAHEGGANSVAWSLAGDQLFSGGNDKAVRRWAAADGKELAGFTGPTDVVSTLSVSADGKRLLAGSIDKNLYAWPIAAATAAPVAAEQTIALTAAAKKVHAGAAGLRIAVATDDEWVTVYDSASGQILERLAGHTMPVADVRLIAKDAKLVSASADKTSLVHTIQAQRVIGNEGAVVDLEVSVDGMWTITCDAKTIRILNTVDGAELFAAPLASPPTAMALRGDKLQLAVATADNKLSLYPLDAKGPGAPVVVDLPAAASSAAYHHASNRLAVSCGDSTCRIYDSVEPRLLEEVALAEPAAAVAYLADPMTCALVGAKGGSIQPTSLVSAIVAHEGAATGVAFSADGASVVSAGADKAVHQWSLADGARLRSFASPADAVTSLDIGADGKTLAATSADNNLTLWDASQPANAATPTAVLKTIALPAASAGVSVSADGSRIAAASDDGVVRVWETASGLELQRFAGHEGAVSAVAILADGKAVLSGGADKTFRQWSVAATQLIIADATSVGDAAYLPDGSQFAATGADMSVKLFDAAGAEVKKLAGAKAPLQRLSIRGDGSQLAAGDSAGNLLVWNLADGALVHTIETATPASDLSFSPSGEQLAATGADKHVRVFQTADAALLQDHELAVAAGAVRFTPGGREILVGGDKTAATFAYAAAEPVSEFTGHTGAVYQAKFSPDGAAVATCGNDQTVRLYNAATGELIKQFTGHTDAVYSVRFIAAGKQLLTSSADGTARTWNVDTGALIRTFAPELAEGESPTPLFDAAANSTAAQIAAAGQNRQIYIWNAADGKLAQTMTDHADAVYQLEFQATRLLSVGQAGNLHVWNPANATQTSVAKLPGVCFGAALSPDAANAIFPCSDGKAYLLALPK